MGTRKQPLTAQEDHARGTLCGPRLMIALLWSKNRQYGEFQSIGTKTAVDRSVFDSHVARGSERFRTVLHSEVTQANPNPLSA